MSRRRSHPPAYYVVMLPFLPVILLWRLARLPVRFVLGRELVGERRTDATLFREGAVALDPADRTWRWHYLPLWRRSVIRVVAAAVLWILWRWHAAHPWGFAVSLRVAAVLAVLAAGPALVALWRSRRLWREVTWPLVAALLPVLHWPSSRPARQWLIVPRHLVEVPPTVWALRWGAFTDRCAKHRDEWLEKHPDSRPIRAYSWLLGIVSWFTIRKLRVMEFVHRMRKVSSAVVVAVPLEMGAVSPEVRKAVVTHVETKLGGEWRHAWQLQGRKSQVIFTPKPKPPARVDYEMIKDRLLVASEPKLVLGLKAGYRTVYADLEADSPHILLSMGSGAGKSVLLRLLAIQALAKGWVVVLLDYKQDHHWAQELIDMGVENLHYIRKIPDIHDAWVNLEKVRAWRSEVDHAARGKQPMQRVLILFEEMNISAGLLKAHWVDIKEKGASPRSPAFAGFVGISTAGRSANMHAVAVGQYLTADVFGGSSGRESFGIRILGRYSLNMWKLLVPEHLFRGKVNIRGRVQVCTAEGVEETQVAFLKHEEAVEFVTEYGKMDVPPGVLPFSWETGVSPVPLTVPVGSDVPEPGGHPGPGDTPEAAEDAEPARRALVDWVELEVVPWGYETAKKYRQRDTKRGTFPVHEDYRYTEDEMREWVETRSRLKAS